MKWWYQLSLYFLESLHNSNIVHSLLCWDTLYFLSQLWSTLSLSLSVKQIKQNCKLIPSLENTLASSDVAVVQAFF